MSDRLDYLKKGSHEFPLLFLFWVPINTYSKKKKMPLQFWLYFPWMKAAQPKNKSTARTTIDSTCSSMYVVRG